MIQSVHGRNKLRNRVLLMMAWDTAARVSELAGMRWGCLDFVRQECRFFRPKAQDWHIVAVGASSIAALRDYAEITETRRDKPVFATATGRAMTIAGIQRVVMRTATEVGIPKGWRYPHAIRHGRAVAMIENGQSLEDVRELLGHADVSTTQVYTRLSRDSYREGQLGSTI